MRQPLMTAAAAPPAAGRQPLLHLEEIVVDFGSNRALSGVSLGVHSGEIVGLVGANGAGKSTLAKVMVAEIPYGAYQGTVRVGGSVVQFSDTRAAHRAGIALVHQEGSVVPQLSVGENAMLTIEPARGGVIDWPELHLRAQAALDKVGLSVDTRRPLGAQGGVALMELVEVARAIARGSRLFVFDESTSALGADEIRLLLGRMLELAASGCGIVFISHRIDEVLQICDRVVVLRDGRVALDQPRSDLDHDRIVAAMLGAGRAATAASSATVAAYPDRPAALSIRDWHVRRSADNPVAVGPLDLEVAAGEIIGVYGPLGAGKTELVQSIYGLTPELVSGAMHLGGDAVRLSGPREAISRGLAYVSAERQRDGLVPQLSVLENMLLGWHREGPHRSGQRIRHEESAEVCRRLIRDLGIRTTGPEQPISALSGGNQQKVLLARALLNSPSVLLLDEPTRGIDVGAKQDVYRLIRQIAGGGTGVLFTSMEEAETLMLADRVVVLRDGRLIEVLRPSEANEHRLLALAGGVR